VGGAVGSTVGLDTVAVAAGATVAGNPALTSAACTALMRYFFLTPQLQ
jgi:hypothetical protein